ncbi:MAG: hypothetical protein O7G85_02255, partial [Planctomycetota bacterium]|nr:hypothetical protein [Planctomycetota bacterium]
FNEIQTDFDHDGQGDACDPFGDINEDGVVDVTDLLLLVHAFGLCEVVEACPADLDGDGVIDQNDLYELLHSGNFAPGNSGGHRRDGDNRLRSSRGLRGIRGLRGR